MAAGLTCACLQKASHSQLHRCWPEEFCSPTCMTLRGAALCAEIRGGQLLRACRVSSTSWKFLLGQFGCCCCELFCPPPTGWLLSLPHLYVCFLACMFLASRDAGLAVARCIRLCAKPCPLRYTPACTQPWLRLCAVSPRPHAEPALWLCACSGARAAAQAPAQQRNTAPRTRATAASPTSAAPASSARSTPRFAQRLCQTVQCMARLYAGACPPCTA